MFGQQNQQAGFGQPTQNTFGFGQQNQNTGAGGNATSTGFGTQPAGGFGNTTQPTGGLFGNTTQPTGGLFGNTNTTAQPAARGLFGNTSATTAQPTTGGLFGNATTNTSQAAAGGLFGNTNTSTTQPSNMFGSVTNNTAGGLFGQKSTTQPGFGQAQTSAPITLSTKYSELPPDIQSQLDTIEKFINSQSGVSTSISNLTLEKDLQEIVKETEETSRKLSGLKTILQRDVYVIDQLKTLVAKELRNTDLVARFIESSPTNDFNKGIQTNDAYSNYFLNFTNDLEMRMNQCRQNIEELELNLRSSHTPKINATGTISLNQVIQEIIKNQYQSFMSIAGKVAQVHDTITKAKDIYIQFHEKYYGNVTPENNRESYSQLAQYLQPTVQQPVPQQLNQSQFGQSQFGTQSFFGAKPADTKPAFALSTKPATAAAPTLNTSLFGNPIGGVGMKRSNSLGGAETKKLF
ncbi:Nucleoporin p58/p45 [Boothiomyces sp. JEL0838]|nr:Nucleoporin p58/p45 [Boothiomyces sp. JEL0838]